MARTLGWLVFSVLAGCGSRSSIGVRDGGSRLDTARSFDAPAGDDATVSGDVVAPAERPADMVGLTDVASDRETTPDLLAQPDSVAADLVVPDGRVETGASDLSDADPNLPRDTTDALLPDLPPEARPADAARDLAPDLPPEAAPEVPPLVVDGALASFCSGDTARMVLNGIESYPVVTGRQLPLSCCSSSQFIVTTQTFAEPLVVTWWVSGGLAPSNPVVLDLGSLPRGWSMWVVAGCDPLLTTCTTEGDDVYDSGFAGVLELTGARADIDMSLCLHLVEPPGSSHPLIHTLELYAPHVLATY